MCSANPNWADGRRYFTLRLEDGERAGQTKSVRLDGSTMSDIRLDDGTWLLYDRRNGTMFSVSWRESGEPTEDSCGRLIVPVIETRAEVYSGVL